MDKIEIVTSYVKLANYLNKNQLIQANAMTQRIEAQIKDETGQYPTPTEPFYQVYKTVKKVQQQIILGNTDKAIEFTSQMRVDLQDKEDIKETINEIKKTLGDS